VEAKLLSRDRFALCWVEFHGLRVDPLCCWTEFHFLRLSFLQLSQFSLTKRSISSCWDITVVGWVVFSPLLVEFLSRGWVYLLLSLGSLSKAKFTHYWVTILKEGAVYNCLEVVGSVETNSLTIGNLGEDLSSLNNNLQYHISSHHSTTVYSAMLLCSLRFGHLMYWCRNFNKIRIFLMVFICWSWCYRCVISLESCYKHLHVIWEF